MRDAEPAEVLGYGKRPVSRPQAETSPDVFDTLDPTAASGEPEPDTPAAVEASASEKVRRGTEYDPYAVGAGQDPITGGRVEFSGAEMAAYSASREREAERRREVAPGQGDESARYVEVGGETIDLRPPAPDQGMSMSSDYVRLSPNPPMRSGLGVGTRGEGRGTRRSALDSDRWGRWRPLVVVGGADGGPGQRRWGGVGGTACRGRQSRTGPVRLCGVGWVVWWTGQAPSVSSGRQWQGSQSSEGATELGFPGPALGQMQSEAAGRAGEPSGHREEAPPEGPGGYHLLPQTDAHGPAGQVIGQHLDGQPGAVGGEAARGDMVEADAVLESQKSAESCGVNYGQR